MPCNIPPPFITPDPRGEENPYASGSMVPTKPLRDVALANTQGFEQMVCYSHLYMMAKDLLGFWLEDALSVHKWQRWH